MRIMASTHIYDNMIFRYISTNTYSTKSIFFKFPPLIVPKKNEDGSVTISGILANYFETMKEVMNFT